MDWDQTARFRQKKKGERAILSKSFYSYTQVEREEKESEKQNGDPYQWDRGGASSSKTGGAPSTVLELGVEKSAGGTREKLDQY